MRPDRPSDLNIRALLTTAAFAVAAGAISGCGGSAAPAQPVFGGGGRPTPTPHATPTPTVGPTGAPTPTPPPSGGGVAAACVLTLAGTGKTYAFVPAFSAADSQGYPDSLAEVTIANGTTIAGTHRHAAQIARRYHRISAPTQRQGARRATIAAGAAVSPVITFTPSPAECAADSAHSTLYLMSNGTSYPASPIISVVTVNPSTAAFSFLTDFTTDAATEFTYSGGSFDISGIAYDPKQSGVIISSSTGYEVYGGTSPYSKLKSITGNPSENFGFNPVTDQIFSPTYADYPTDLGLADLGSLSYFTNSADPSDLTIPDAGAVDSLTNVGLSPSESAEAEYMVNLNGFTTSAGTYTPVGQATLVITGPLVSGITEQTDAGLNDVAIDSPTHLAFLAGEFGTTGFCVVAMPTSIPSGAPAASDYACATFPTTPDAAEFNAPFDPHATSTFELGTKPYGLMFNQQDTFVAIIDLQAMMSAPRDPGDPHAVTSASALGAIVSYVQI
jgi:hypothetical protein